MMGFRYGDQRSDFRRGKKLVLELMFKESDRETVNKALELLNSIEGCSEDECAGVLRFMIAEGWTKKEEKADAEERDE
jgi:hypothetical protein